MTQAEEEARILIASVVTALRSGVKHYNGAGKELTTPLEVIETLLTEGSVTLEDGKMMRGKPK